MVLYMDMRRPAWTPLFPYTTLFRSVEAHLARQRKRRRKIPLALAGETDDEVRGNRDVGPHRAQLAHLFLEFERGIAALHERQHPVRAALHRQVQVVGELADTGERLDQAVVELERVGGGEADALDARHARGMVDERGEI